MPKVHHVKKARKHNKQAGIKKGDEYWWAGYRLGRGSFKRYWKKRPRPSQVTASEFYAGVYSIQEEMYDAKPESSEDLESMRDEWVSQIEEIASDCQDKFDNMPDGLQQGDTGQLLEERAENMTTWASSVQDVDCEWVESEGGDSFEDFAEAALSEMRDACPE